MLHLLPPPGASTTASTPQGQTTPRTAKGLRKQICEDVSDVVRAEYQALRLLLEERLQRMEQVQRDPLRNYFLEDRLQRIEKIQREALREQADLIKESFRKYKDAAETMSMLLPAATPENCKLPQFHPATPKQMLAPEVQLPDVQLVSQVDTVADPGPSTGSLWSKNIVTHGDFPPHVAQVHPAPMSASSATSVEEKATKTVVEEEPEPLPCQPTRATQPPKRPSGQHGIQALAGASGWAKASAEEEQEQSKLRSVGQSSLFMFSPVSPKVRQRLLDIVLHPWFEFAAGVAIVSNAIFMGVKTQVLLSDAKHGEASNSENAFHALELVFTIIFIIEWVMRLAAFPRLFFSTKERAWHLFDTVLILAGIVEVIVDASAGGGSSTVAQGGETMILRVLRIIRLMRLLRIVRFVSAFRELRLLISGLLGSTRSLLWSVVLLAVVIYLFGVFFEQGVLTYITEGNKKEGALPRRDELLGYFGSLEVTMTTMFGVISGGEDWMTVMSPLAEMSGFYTFAFIMYIFVTTNGILHVIVGIFVESTMAASRNDKDLVISDELARKDSYMAQMNDVLRETDSDESGTISWEEFETKLQDHRVIAYFAALELDVAEARGLFELLDTEELDEVPIDEFVVGCFRLKGGAKGIDLAALMYENKKMMKTIRGFMHMTEDRMDALDRSLASMTQFLPKAPVVKQGNFSQLQDVPSEIS